MPGTSVAINMQRFKPPAQGKRTDLQSLADFVLEESKKGLRAVDITRGAAKRFGSEFIKYHGGVERLIIAAKPGAYYEEAPTVDKLYVWQRNLADRLLVDAEAGDGKCVLRPAPSREILFLFDPIGNAGKSTMTSFFSNAIGPENIVELSGEHKDAAYAYSQVLAPVAVYDVARADTSAFKGICKLAEGLSNGRLMIEKYVSQAIVFKRPHIIIICNTLPPNLSELLSVDRVRIWPVCKPKPAPNVVDSILSFETAKELDDYIAIACPVKPRVGMNL